MRQRSGIAGTRVRAVVLAAGYGRRLGPLTESVPKPLFPVVGRSLLIRTLARLAALGCETAAINLHHLGDQIRDAVGADFRGMPILYSEEPTILGTLGALHPLREFLAPADVILILNSDTLCAWPLEELVAHHRVSSAQATLLLAARPDPDDYGGGVGIDSAGSVVALAGATSPGSRPPTRRLVFGGAQALDPRLLAHVPAGVSDSIRDLHAPMLADGHPLASLVTRRRWHDMGTPQRFLEGVLEVAPRGWISRRAILAPGAAAVGSVLEEGAVVEAGARIDRSVLLPGAHVGEHAVIRDALVGFGAVIEAHGRLLGALAARDGIRTPLGRAQRD